ncbi:DnaJ domain protein [Gregarina niphandrodes]|uniref:DnaJ domain protein n=1 Tax=Gregarina niphandrodes TaxID=110365 RepID=A0A023B6V7_GRENI|nr:DnaJ domain protein [Gregarina niphandrodes]EZG66807.1 DnaJ domain protein [Gregarina niphandrodes]|eukprot:XP_011130479.1 DnaJ domain protein [Gregarina niphandrodes]
MNVKWWVVALCALVVAGEDDYYKVLGVSRKATPDQIRKAYKILTKKYHPDVNKDPDATAKFSAVAEAYGVLSDPKQRKKYDRFGKESLQGGDSEGPSSIFDLFNFGGGRRRRPADKVDDTYLTLYVSLSQLYSGDHITVRYTRSVLCLRADECVVDRNDCVGPGSSMTARQIAPGYYVEHQSADPLCLARGRGLKSNRCRYCPKGINTLQTTTVHGFISPGMKDDDTIKFEGAGEQQMDLDPGDLIIRLKTESESDVYVRDHHNNLYTQLYITLAESLLGFNTTIPHLSGQPIQITKQSITPDGYSIKLPGKGMPDQLGKFGDLFVKIRVSYPDITQFKPEHKEALNRILPKSLTWNYVATPNTST